MPRAPLIVPLTLLASSACAGRAYAEQDPWFGSDKALHFGISSVLAGGSYAASTLWLELPWQRATLAAAFTLSVGAAKELYDATGRGDPSLRDFTWDLLGCAVGVALAYVIDISLSTDAGTAWRVRTVF